VQSEPNEQRESGTDTGEAGRRQSPVRRAAGAPLAVRLVASAITFALLIVGWLVMLSGMHRIGQPFPGFLALSNRVVVLVASPDLPANARAEILFAQVVSADGTPLTSAYRVERHLANRQLGEHVKYGFQARGEVIHRTLTVRAFTLRDYLELYVVLFAAGFCFCAAGLWAVWKQASWSPAPTLFFVFSQTIATMLYTAGDLYGRTWFEPLYFAAHCLAPVTLIHLSANFPAVIAAGYPLRRLSLTVVYVIAAGMFAAMRSVFDEPPLFLPLLYTLYLLLVNAFLLYLARLAVAAWIGENPSLRAEVRRNLAALLVSGAAAGALFAAGLTAGRAILPVILAAPLALFPIVAAPAMASPRLRSPTAETASVRMRLSLLFLGAVETTFLIAVALFWVDNSRERLFDELRLFHRQLSVLQSLRDGNAVDLEREFARIGLTPASEYDRFLVDQVRDSVHQGDRRAAREMIARLAQRYEKMLDDLDRQRRIVGSSAATLVMLLIAGGMIQAFLFVAAVQRWLLKPIRQLADATGVIATGDLAYRIRLEAADEFGALGESINRMAQSLGDIQRRIDAEREARREAADSAREAERRRMARELHDSVLQDLGGIKLALEREQRRAGAAQPQPAIDELIGTINELRRVVDDLRPTDLSVVSLREAIASYARTRTHGTAIQLQIDLPEDIEIPDWLTRDVLRVAQEAINNAVRHGSPTHLGIYLYRQEDRIALEISDDGPGFDPERVALGGGIRGMRERAAAQGGDLEITSVPGEGTMIRMLVPAGGEPRPFHYAEE